MSAAKKYNQNGIIEKLDDLPTLPSVVHELTNILNDPMASTSDVERVMKNDQSLTSKVLKLANSAYYAIPGGVSTLSRAVAYLGFDTVSQLVLTASILKTLNTQSQDTAFCPNKFWQHSLGVAMAADLIADKQGYKNPAELFTCGLIHDIGKIAAYVLEPDLVNEITKIAMDRNLTYWEAEKEIGVPNHCLIGQMLIHKWRLPASLLNSVQYHHTPTVEARKNLSPEMNQIVDIVCLSNLLIHGLKFGDSGYSVVPAAPKSLFDRLSIKQSDFPKLIKDIKNSLSTADNFLKTILED